MQRMRFEWILLVFLSMPIWAYGGAWRQLADIPLDRPAQQVVELDGQIYLLEGFGSAQMLGYDPTTDTWTRRADVPPPHNAFGVAAVDGLLYVLGGTDDIIDTADGRVNAVSDRVHCYDPATDNWSAKAPMPTGRIGMDAQVVNGQIYALGGFVEVAFPQFGAAPVPTVVEAYDPAIDRWNTKAAAPLVSRGVFQILAGELHVLGAAPVRTSEDTTFWQGLWRLDAYDSNTDRWIRKADLPTPRTDPAIAVLDDQLYVLGGAQVESFRVEDGGGGGRSLGTLDRVEVYDPDLDSWQQRSRLPQPRRDAAALSLGRRIYLLGGTNQDNISDCINERGCLAQVAVYDAAEDSWWRTAARPTLRSRFPVLSTRDKIYALDGRESRLEVFTSADFNDDSRIDLADFHLFADHFGRRIEPGEARFDFDGDGGVRLTDFFLFLDQFGQELERVEATDAGPAGERLVALPGGAGDGFCLDRARHLYHGLGPIEQR